VGGASLRSHDGAALAPAAALSAAGGAAAGAAAASAGAPPPPPPPPPPPAEEEISPAVKAYTAEIVEGPFAEFIGNAKKVGGIVEQAVSIRGSRCLVCLCVLTFPVGAV
jgi:hypothetical protein